MKKQLKHLTCLILLIAATTVAADNIYQKPDDAELRKKLTPLQYDVTQKKATEPAFKNAYWNNEAQGIYVDVVTGEPLFISTDKYDSGTGWPSFTKPLEPDNLVLTPDNTFFTTRTEVSSKQRTISSWTCIQ